MSDQYSLQRLKPRHLEIMHRLIIGQSQREISSELGINESRLSVIVRTPLFQKELSKLIKKREMQLLKGDEYLYEAYSLAPKLHLDIIENPELPIPYRQNSATAIINAMNRKLSKSPSSYDRTEEEEPFEKRLEKIREVTFREKTFADQTNGSSGGSTIEAATIPEPDMPSDEILDIQEEEAMEEEIEEEEEEEE